MLQTVRTCLAVGMLLLSGNSQQPAEDNFSKMFGQCETTQAEAAPFIFPYTQEEVDMVASVVMHEVGYCSRESKIAVANVILNRVKDGRFGKDIYEVLHGKNQFTAINNYYTHQIPPDKDCIEAVIDAMMGEDNSYGALYFCNPKYVNSRRARQWFSQLELAFQLDGQNFYK